MLFKYHVSYENIKKLKPNFGESVHNSWCSHLPDNTKESYALSNHIKFPRKKRGVLTTSNINYFHGRCSVLKVLRSHFKLKLFNCSHRRHSELTGNRGSMIEVIIHEIVFIIFHCGLVHCETPSCFISRCEYSFNTRAFSTIVKKYFKLRNETTVQIGNDLCSIETWDVCKHNKHGNMEGNGPLIYLRLVKKSNANINQKQKRVSLTLIW